MQYIDGVAYVQNLGRGTRHPIEELIERGKRKAEEVEKSIKAVRSFSRAVEDYKRAFGMDPPEGFHEWYVHRFSRR